MLALALLAACGSSEPTPATDADYQAQLLEQLITAEPGATIEIPAGTWNFDRGLSLSVDGVTLRGAGIDETVLNFAGQEGGAEGLLVTGDDFTIEDLAIEDTAGDGLKVKGADGVVIRRVRAEWTGGPDEDNGSYGLYPVECRDVLIEDSVAIAASDAGIYVGQSHDIVVRNSRAERNVAGIEIENSTGADVYGNTATGNTGGVLIFDLPDLQVKNGERHRVFDNTIVGNNHDNFAPDGTTVAFVPPGTGLLVMAANQVEVFDNEIRDHDTTAVAVVSYQVMGKDIADPDYDPYVEGIWVHDNRISEAGASPRGLLIRTVAMAMGGEIPAMLWDGIVHPERVGPEGRPVGEDRICFQRNGDAGFANLDAPNDFEDLSEDLSPFDCALEPLAAATVEGVEPHRAPPGAEGTAEEGAAGGEEAAPAEGSEQTPPTAGEEPAEEAG